MNLKYKLTKEDFLFHQLYSANHSKTIKRNALNGQIALIVGFTSFTSVFYLIDEIFLVYFSAIFSVLIILMFPFFRKRALKRRLSEYVDEHYVERFGKEYNIQFNEDDFQIIDDTGEAKIKYSSLEKVIELSSHYLLKSRSKGTLIIPKSAFENTDVIKAKLEALSEQLKIEYAKELNWKWK